MNIVAISQLARTVDVTRAFVVTIVAIVVVVIVVIVIVVIIRLIWIELGEIGIGSRSYGRNNMRGTNIDYMCVTSDTMVQRIEANRDGCLAFSEQ